MSDNFFTPVAETVAQTPDENTASVGTAPARPVPEPEPQDADPNAFTHYVHLADGRVLRANLTGSHTDAVGNRYYETDVNDIETSVAIIGVYPR